MRCWELYFKRVIIVFGFLVCWIATSYAQEQILFVNQAKGKVFQAKLGDQLSIKYRGYLGQTETFKQTLTEINDSSFVLGYAFLGSALIPNKEIKYTDIIAFRRIGLGRVILKTTLSLGTAVGVILLLDRTYKSNDFSLAGKFGISFGVGLGVNLLLNGLLPDNPKYQTKEGWQIYPIRK